MLKIITGGMLAGGARAILAALGIGIVTYTGAETVLNRFVGVIQSNFAGAGGSASGIIGLMGIPECVSLIISGYSVRIALATLKRFKLF